MLVGEHQDPRTIGQDRRPLLGMEETLDGAIHDEVSGGQTGDHSSVVCDGHRSAGGANRHRPPIRGRRKHHGRHLYTQTLEGHHGRLDQRWSSVILGQHHCRLSGNHGTTGEVVRESLDPVPRHSHLVPLIPHPVSRRKGPPGQVGPGSPRRSTGASWHRTGRRGTSAPTHWGAAMSGRRIRGPPETPPREQSPWR